MIKKFFGFIGKLFQGAGRLIGTALLCVAALLVTYLILKPIFISSQLSGTSPIESSLLIAPFISFALCIAIQVVWDVLDIGLLDNIVGRIIKRIIYFAVLAIGFLVTIIQCPETFAMHDLYELGFIGKGLVLAFAFAPSAVAVIYTFVIVKEEEKGVAPWLPLYAWGGSVVLGLVTSLCLGFSAGLAGWLPTLGILGAIAFMIIFMIKERTLVFSENNSPSYSGYSSGGRSSGYSPSYYNDDDDDDDDTPTDKRTSDLFDMLKGDFYKVASNHSTSHSIGYGASVLFDIDMSTYGNSVVFTVNGRLYNADSFTSQYEVDKAQDNLQSAMKTVMQRVYNDAERAIRNAQEKYTDYEHYELSVEPGNVY